MKGLAGKSPFILIADDEPRFCETLNSLLSGHGFRISTSGSGQDTLRILSRHSVDVLLLDLFMPDIHGLRILDYLQEQDSETTVIVITGHPSLETAVEALKKGAYDFLKKPFEEDALVRSVQKALDYRRIHRERKQAEEALRRREAILHAVSTAAERFLRISALTKEGILQVLAGLGQATQVDRVYVVEIQGGSNGSRRLNQGVHWEASGIAPRTWPPEAVPEDRTMGLSGGWEELLARGHLVRDRAPCPAPANPTFLEGLDVRSVLAVPIFVRNRWWGFMGFDDCHVERLWTSAEIDALKTSAAMLGALMERREVEHELRVSRGRYELATRAGSVGLWDRKLDTDEIYIEPNLKAMLGYQDHEIENRLSDWCALIHPDDGATVWKEVNDHIEGRTSQYRSAHRMIHKDGSVRWFLAQGHVIPDFRGTPGRIVGTATDITDRVRAEESLRISEAAYRTIFNTVGDGISVHDLGTLQLVDANQSLAELLGYSREELSTLKWEDLNGNNGPGARFRVLRSLKKAMNGEVRILEWMLRNREGHAIWVELTLRKACIGGVDRLLVMVRDITFQRNMEHQLANTRKLEAVGTLAGGIAHDFNNLLSIILGNVEVARLSLNHDSQALRMLSGAEQAVHKARDLTRKFITFATGGAPVRRPVLTRKLIEDSVAMALSDSDIRCEFSFAPDLRPVEVDWGQMVQVLYEITKNARQSMPMGGVIHVKAENLSGEQRDSLTGVAPKHHDYVRISIRDHGLGIPEEHLSRIFDPYFSTHERGSVKGLGLGLAMAYSVIKKHGGTIHVESRVGTGTELALFLPAALPRPVSDPCLLPKTELWKKRVLCMDDEEMLRHLLVEMLARLGFEAVAARNGEEAVDLFRKARIEGRPFDAVILDLTVTGGMGGEDTLRHLLELDPEVRAVVCSGYATDPLLDHFEDYGFRASLAKPYSMEQLADTLRRVLSFPEH